MIDNWADDPQIDTISHPPQSKKRGRWTFTLGRLMISTCTQAAGAPIIDHASMNEVPKEPRRWKGFAVVLRPWRRDRHGDRPPQKALVIGWQR